MSCCPVSALFQSLTITDDTVLEEHNEDPALIQMRLIDNGGKWCFPTTTLYAFLASQLFSDLAGCVCERERRSETPR